MPLPDLTPKDSDPFPFGQYKSKRYDQVPAQYLDYLLGMEWIDSWPRVKMYIKKNKSVIDTELKEQEDE